MSKVTDWMLYSLPVRSLNVAGCGTVYKQGPLAFLGVIQFMSTVPDLVVTQFMSKVPDLGFIQFTSKVLEHC